MSTERFDGDAFFSAIDAQRQAKKLTWKKVAEEAKVPASTLTRMSQGKRPDIDSLAALCSWAGLSAENFYVGEARKIGNLEPLALVTAHFRADPKLSSEGAKALEALIKTAYQQLRIK
jgi:transcriptional regulator with XRE-family HTH domain